jgi:hypothetical protein
LLKYILAKLLEATKRGSCSSEPGSSGEGAGLESFHHLWCSVLGYLVPECATVKPHVFAVLKGMSARILHPAGTPESVFGTAADAATAAVTPTATVAVGASYTDSANLFSAEDGELVRDYFRAVGAEARRTHTETFV